MRSINNKILQRVRRHANIAALFRSNPSAPGQYPFAKTIGDHETQFTPPADAIQRATLPASATTLPEGQVVNLPLAASEAGLPVMPSNHRIERPAFHEEPAKNVDTAPESQTTIPVEKTVPQEPAFEADKVGWRRLQAIFHRHHEKNSVEETTAEQGTQFAPVQRKPAQEPSPEDQPQAIASKESGSQVFPRPSISAQPAPAVGTGLPNFPPIVEKTPEVQVQKEASEKSAGRSATVEIRLGSETAPVQSGGAPRGTGLPHPVAADNEQEPLLTRPLPPQRSEEPEKAGVIGQAAPLANPLGEKSTERNEQGAIPAEVRGSSPQVIPSHETHESAILQAASIQDESDEPVARFAADETHVLPGDQVDDEIQPDRSQSQSLPLQQVWPVQRREAPADPKPGLWTAPGDSSESRLDTISEGEIPKALRGVTPDQATTSSIEFIPPRHARPEPLKAPLPASQSAQPVVQIGKTDQQTAKGRQIKPGSRPVNESGRPQNVPAEGGPPALPIQLQQENGLTASRDLPVNEQIPQPEMVPTEIGPLPADLWQLLGESLPGQSLPEKQDHPVQHQNAASPPGRPDPARQAVTAAEATNPPEIPAGQAQKITPNQRQQKNAGAAAVVQRIPEDNEVVMEPVDMVEPAQAETTTQAEPGQADAPDLDELARQVFTEIKRRLSVEWERYRWRE